MYNTKFLCIVLKENINTIITRIYDRKLSLNTLLASKQERVCYFQLRLYLYLLQQFLFNDFSMDYVATRTEHTYYPVIMFNWHPFELTIRDIPEIPHFPLDTYSEWDGYRCWGLRSANAYIMVFDLSNLETFQYLQKMRQQILKSRGVNKIPLLFVGNKQDLVPIEENEPGRIIEMQNISNRRRDIVEIVEKHWHCGYIQCSARYNWHVTAVFSEIIKSIHASNHVQPHPNLSVYDEEVATGNKCIIM